MIQLYRSHIRPHLEYGSIVWNPGLKGDIDALEDVQKFALRMCTKSWNFNYEELLTNANLPSLRTRRVQANLYHLFKVAKGLTDYPNTPLQLQEHNHNTRSADKPNFLVPYPRTNSYQNSFFPNIISIWNTLPKEARNSTSISTFKEYVSSLS